jgi:hypothetical protein
LSEANFEGGHPGPELLSAWHDGELHDEAARSVRQHLDGCAACRQLLDEYRQLDQATRLADDATPDGETWEGIEGRLRLRLEEELGLGIPVGAATPYVETDADVVLRPTLAEVRAGKGARPFRLRWALATAAGLGLGLFTLRTLSDNGWSVSKVMDPAAGRRQNEMAARQVEAPAPGLAAPPVAPEATMADQAVSSPAEVTQGRMSKTAANAAATGAAGNADLAGKADEDRTGDGAESRAGAPAGGGELGNLASDTRESGFAQPPGAASIEREALQKGDERDAAETDAARYLAEVESSLRGRTDDASRATPTATPAPAGRDEFATAAPAPTAVRSPAAARSGAGTEAKSEAQESSAKRKAAAPDPQYAAVFAAASRASQAGDFHLAQRGFGIVARGIPDHPLARDAEFEERLAGAHATITGGATPAATIGALRREGAEAEAEAAVAGGAAGPLACRRALAIWRAVRALEDEFHRTDTRPADEARVARLRSCAG